MIQDLSLKRRYQLTPFLTRPASLGKFAGSLQLELVSTTPQLFARCCFVKFLAELIIGHQWHLNTLELYLEALISL